MAHDAESWTTVVRLARPEEYDRVGEITVEAYLKDDLVRPGTSYVSFLRDAADRAEHAVLLVAEVGGRLVGSVTYCPPGTVYAQLAAPGEAEFRMLAVVVEARGHGVGDALVQECVDRATQAGYTGLWLSTQRAFGAANRLYVRKGFVRTPDRDYSAVPGMPLLTYYLALQTPAT